MADRYWISGAGGTGNWNDTARWSASSGGGGGASVPTTADNVFFDNASHTGTFTVTITAGSACANFDASGITDPAKKMTLTGSGSLNVAGGWVNPTTNFYAGTFSSAVTFSSTTTGNIINTNGVLFSTNVNATAIFNGVSGEWKLAGAFTLSGVNAYVTLTNGALDLAGFTLSAVGFLSSNSNVRSVAFGTTGAIVLSGGSGAVWSMATATNFSYTGSSSVTVFDGSVQHGSTAGGIESNAINVTITSSSTGFTTGSHVRNFTTTGSYSGSFQMGINIYGDINIGALTNFTASTNVTTIRGSGTQNITMNGRALDQPITFSGTGTYNLVDGLTTGSTRAVTLTSGTLALNGKTLTTGTFATTGATARVLAFGTSGAISVSGSGATAWNATGSGLTTSGSGTINMTSASAKTFVGGGYNYAAALNQGGAGALTISGSNTFQNITNTYATTGATTITFTAATTQTVSNFTASGTVGNILTLNSSSAGSRFNLSDPSGTVVVSYCNITDSNATGGATWNSYTSNGNINGGNNVGWVFDRKGGLTFTSGISISNRLTDKTGLSDRNGLVGSL